MMASSDTVGGASVGLDMIRKGSGTDDLKTPRRGDSSEESSSVVFFTKDNSRLPTQCYSRVRHEPLIPCARPDVNDRKQFALTAHYCCVFAPKPCV